jgi:signal transduction histidine kinase
MPSAETNAQTFNVLIRTRTLCLLLMAVLLWVAEDVSAAPAVEVGWAIILAGMTLSVLFGALGKIKRLTGVLLPLLFILDSFLVGAWVAFSGGPVSFYIPFFLLILVASVLVLPPPKALFVVVLVITTFLATLFLDYTWGLSSLLGAGKINSMYLELSKSPPEAQKVVYWKQATRWFFFFLLMIAVSGLLMRRVWAREERLRVRERELEQKRHLIQMGELTGRIAHGVNTPLGLISGNLEMLMGETRKGSKTYKNLAQIEQYVQRAIRTVRGILDYSRQSLSEIKPLSLPKVIQAVTTAVQPKLKKAGGKMILDLEPKLPEVMAYPEGLFQVLLNLAENAVDSIGPGGIVTLSARFQYRSLRLSAHDRRGEIKIVVRDTGRGIPAGELERIFEPFYSTKGFGKGTGLGLSIVKRIVDEHHGDIKVESRVGEGTVFTLLLPTDGLAREGAPPEDFYYNETIPRKKGQDG